MQKETFRERFNRKIGVEAREKQIKTTWKVPLLQDWKGHFDAAHLAEQEKWGVMTTYISALTLVPAAAAAYVNPEIGISLVAADVAVGVVGWLRSQRAITAVEQEKLARHV